MAHQEKFSPDSASPAGFHLTRIRSFTIYQNPLDFPSKWVVRGWTSDARGTLRPDREPHAVVDSFAEARQSIPAGLINVGREPNDDAVIVETWL